MEFLDLMKTIELEILEKQLTLSTFSNSQNHNSIETEYNLTTEYEEEKQLIKTKYHNDNFDKTRKYKILYFLYAFYIYITNNIISLNNDEVHFFKNHEKDWYAFKNGPVFNTYNYLEKDNQIIINWDTFDKKTQSLLKTFLKLLIDMPTSLLIEESHKTDPWKDNYKENSSYLKIADSEIIAFFKVKEPLT